ncbi:MAG: hypothetical protein GXO78_15035 [Calditrichaeota bacterium]|nr:hypothetical protein [Calditrichota bacterium]
MKKIKALIPVLVPLLFFLTCDFKEPVLPRWAVPLILPLSEQTFKMSEVLGDSNIVAQNPDSLLTLQVNGEVDPETLSESELAFQPRGSTNQLEIGILRLDSLQAMNTGMITLAEIFPELASLPTGAQVVIPETTLVPPAKILTAEDYRWIYLEQGTIIIRVINNLPFDLGPNNSSSGIQFTLKNDSLGNQVSDILIDKVVASGDQGEGRDDIVAGGMYVYDRLRLEYNVPIARKDTITITDEVLNQTGIQIIVDLANMEASSVKAKLESQEFQRKVRFALNGRHKIKSGVVSRGNFYLSFRNETAISGKIVYTIPSLIRPDGNPFQDSLFIDQDPINQKIVLDGIKIQNPTDPNVPLDSIEVLIFTKTSKSDQFVTVRSSDNIVTEISSDSLFFKSFTGILAPETIDFGPFEEKNIADYNRLEGGGIRLADVKLILNLFNELYIEDLRLNLTLWGYHEDENGVVTDSAKIEILNQPINPGRPGNPGQTQFVLTGPEVVDFVNILPTSIRGQGEITASGEAEVILGSQVWANYELTTPLKFSIQGMEPVQSRVDTLTEQDIDQELRDALQNDIQEATLTLRVKNHTPLGGKVRMIVTRDSLRNDLFDTTYFNPNKEFIKEIELQAATVDPATGFVNKEVESEVLFNLTRKEMRILSQPPIRVAYELKIADTPGEVALRTVDYITVNGQVKLTVIVNENQ